MAQPSIVVILKLFGALPWKNPSKLENYYKLLVLLVYYALFGLAFSVRDGSKQINFVINTIISSGFFVSITTIIYVSLKNRNVLVEIVNQFDTNSKQNIVVVLIGAILIETSVCDCVILVFDFKTETIWKWLLLTITIFVITYYHAFITLVTLRLYKKCYVMNSFLEYLHKDTMWKRKEGYYLGVVKDMRVLNKNLRNLADEICSCFSLPILASLSTAFFVITVQIYYIVSLFEYSSNEPSTVLSEMKTKLQLCLVNFCFVHCLQYFMLVTGFYWVKEEMDRSSVLINSILINFHEKSIQKEVSF